MIESNPKEGKDCRLVLTEEDKLTMEFVMIWIYFGQREVTLCISKCDFETHANLFKAACKYKISPLQTWISSRIVNLFTKTENAIEIFILGNSYNDDGMLQAGKTLLLRYRDI